VNIAIEDTGADKVTAVHAMRAKGMGVRRSAGGWARRQHKLIHEQADVAAVSRLLELLKRIAPAVTRRVRPRTQITPSMPPGRLTLAQGWGVAARRGAT
jgi:hypothetical protein